MKRFDFHDHEGGEGWTCITYLHIHVTNLPNEDILRMSFVIVHIREVTCRIVAEDLKLAF